MSQPPWREVGGGQGPWRAAHSGSQRGKALGIELWGSTGALGLHKHPGAGPLQGVLLILSNASSAGLRHQKTWLGAWLTQCDLEQVVPTL